MKTRVSFVQLTVERSCSADPQRLILLGLHFCGAFKFVVKGDRLIIFDEGNSHETSVQPFTFFIYSFFRRTCTKQINFPNANSIQARERNSLNRQMNDF